jgi:hypothetical protein
MVVAVRIPLTAIVPVAVRISLTRFVSLVIAIKFETDDNQ